MNRLQVVLTALLAVQILVIAAFGGFFSSQDSAGGERALLPDLDISKVVRVEISESDGDSIVLAKQENTWALEEFDGYPVEGSKVEKVLETMQELSVRRPVVTDSGYHESLEVTNDEFQRRVRIWTTEDEPQFDLIIGSSPTYRVHHVRLAGEDPVYEIRGLDLWSVGTSAQAWIERNLVDVKVDDLVAVEWSNAQGNHAIRKDGGKWLAGELALDENEVDSFLRAVAMVRIAAPVGRKDLAGQGFDPPAASVELAWSHAGDEADSETGEAEAAQSETQTLVWMIGANDPENEMRRFAALADSEYVASLSDSSVKKVLETTIDDLKAAVEQQ